MDSSFTTILFLSITGSVLAIVLFLIKPIIKNHVSKAFLYYIWLPVLFRLLIPAGFWITLPEMTGLSVSSILPSVPSEEYTIELPDDTAPIPQGNTVDQFVMTSPATQHSTGTESPQKVARASFLAFLGDNLMYIWLVGASISFGWHLISYAFFRHKIFCSFSNPSTADLELFNSIHSARKVNLFTSRMTKTPLLMGIIHPLIVLPQISYTANGLEKELQNVFRHELTHWRRHDILYKWFAIFVQSVHWFNPIVYLITREIAKNCELSCDEAVIRVMNKQERIDYGNTLLILASDRNISKLIAATTLSEGKLKDRIVSIRDYKKTTATAIALRP